MNAPPAAITPPLIKRVMDGYRLGLSGIHGPGHWRRVRANGLAHHLEVGYAREDVLEAFADDGVVVGENDPDHGVAFGVPVAGVPGSTAPVMKEASSLPKKAMALARS